MTNLAILLTTGILSQTFIGIIFFAQVVTPDWTLLIGQFGIAAVLAFILVKLEPRLKAIEESQAVHFRSIVEPRLKAIEESDHLLARSMLLLVVSLGQANDAAKEKAREMIRGIDQKFPQDRSHEK